MANRSYAVLHNHSLMSLLDGCSSLDDIASRCKDIGIERCAITDHGNLFAATRWVSTAKKYGVQGLIGIEFYVCPQLATIKDTDTNRKLSHLVMIAKNLNGYRQLVRMVTRSNSNDCYYFKNRLSLEEIAGFLKTKGDIIGICGHMGSTLGNAIITEDKNTGWHLNDNWERDGTYLIEYFHKLFGHENFGVEIQTYESGPGFDELKNHLRILCKKTGAMPITTADAHYARPDQCELQRTLMCTQMRVTMDQAKKGNSDLSIFFESDRLYIPSREELKSWGSTDEELDNTIKITENCEDIDLRRSPSVPKPQLPEKFQSVKKGNLKYLEALCREGFEKRYKNKSIDKAYAEKVAKQLVDYMLLAHKIVQWGSSKGFLINVRGSAAGAVVLYLTGISHVDPIKNMLVFERMYNRGRAETKEDGTIVYHLPDIDFDVPSYARQEIIQYLRDEFGAENVGQIATFSTLKGRAALKDVCRVMGTISEQEVNAICKLMPEEHIISEELNEMKDNIGYSSIIQYCLDVMPDQFAQYARLESDGTISGKYAKEFTMARDMEGIIRGTGIHAAGVVINAFDEPLGDVVPMTNQKKNDKVLGFSGPDLEALGCVKLDILAVSALDAISTMQKYINMGEYTVYDKEIESN